jgi:hypothetical protein
VEAGGWKLEVGSWKLDKNIKQKPEAESLLAFVLYLWFIKHHI